LFPDYGELLDNDLGFLDLSKTFIESDSYVLHAMVDRAYVDYRKGNWQIRLGRQRINWGINLVWNPNDIFNTFNYFDFDYEERPGTDAVRVQYYTGVVSSVELVYSFADDFESSSVAAMVRFNKWHYDWQFLGGYVKDDVVLGAGWSGNIGDAGFRGEMTWFRNTDQFVDTTNQIVASVGADYIFPNSFYLHAGLLYNSSGTTGKASRNNILLTMENLSVKTLTPAKSSLFFETRYQLSPLLTGGLSSILNPYDQSAFISPLLTFSLSDNADALLAGQLFSGRKNTEYGNIGQIYYLRFKWSF
jgi:hypothetical protein